VAPKFGGRLRQIDLLHDDRIKLVMELITLVSRASRPTDVFEIFGPRSWRLRPIDYFVSVSVRNLPAGQYKITRRLNIDSLRAGDFSGTTAQDPWSNWGKIAAHTGGIIGELIADGHPKLVTDLEVRDDPALGDAVRDMRSAIAYPILEAGQPLNWSVQFRRDPAGFSAREFEDMLLQGNMVGAVTRSLVAINEAREANRRLTQQFEEVARVQQSLLPARTPDIPGLTIATSYLTSEQAGGDYYDFIALPRGPHETPGPDRWGILCADVSGHGAAAATVMAMLHGILHCYPGPDISPDAVIRYANAKLMNARLEGSFVTAFFAVFDPADATLRFCNAGHPPPRVRRGSTGAVIALEGGQGLPVGILDEYESGWSHVTLEPGDTVVMYTDGITEAFNDARQMFGLDRFDAALARCSGDPDCVIDSIHTALYDHTHARTRADDQTLVAIRYHGGAG
jgi:sigma-B regulation protein RsbU (phosphoserine phosphatase)